jgi:hypothetical protein
LWLDEYEIQFATPGQYRILLTFENDEIAKLMIPVQDQCYDGRQQPRIAHGDFVPRSEPIAIVRSSRPAKDALTTIASLFRRANQ